MSKKILLSLVSGLMLLLAPATAFAHVVVTPDQAGVAQELVFNVSVPNEKEVPVTNVKLQIPDGVTDVIPTAKDGWKITTIDNGDSKDPAITAINWAGSIPVGQRQDFTFSAQVPGKATEIDWKAYQTYEDGTVVHWDQKPVGSDDAAGDAGPYSVTKVVNDLNSPSTETNSSTSLIGPYVLSGIALLLAIVALVKKRR